MPRGGKPGNRGGPGPKPKPTQLHLLDGTFRKDRHRQRADFTPLPGGKLPPPPDDLPDEVTAAWLRLAKSLEHHYFTVSDVEAFLSLCVVWAAWWKAQAWVFEHGFTDEYETKDGRLVKQLAHEYKVMSDMTNKLLNYFSRFGMTPADRARNYSFTEPPNGKQEEKDEFAEEGSAAKEG